MTRHESRANAFKLVFQCYANNKQFEDIMDAVHETLTEPFDEEPVSVDEFCEQIVKTTMDNLDAIDDCIRPNLKKWTLERLPKVPLAILRISCAQLMYMKEIPDSVVINEAVELAKTFGDDEDYAFVNGVLRSVNASLAEDTTADA